MQLRRHPRQFLPLKDRLALWATETLKLANSLPPGPKRDHLLRKARQGDTASHLKDWANSPGLQPPK
jgi:hypothetical protein